MRIAAILKGTKEPPEKLVALLKSENLGVRITAARAIAQIQPGQRRAIQTLRDAWGTTWPVSWGTGAPAGDPDAPRNALLAIETNYISRRVKHEQATLSTPATQRRLVATGSHTGAAAAP